jgi:drug/metabolite transporter (DMT)-like permease
VVDSPYLPADGVRAARGPTVGYLMVMGAAVLFAVNGTVSKVVLESGVTSLRLTQARCAGALLGLGLIVLLTRPASLRTTRRELAFLAVFGVCAARDRRLAADPVHGAAARRALGAVRLQGARA